MIIYSLLAISSEIIKKACVTIRLKKAAQLDLESLIMAATFLFNYESCHSS